MSFVYSLHQPPVKYPSSKPGRESNNMGNSRPTAPIRVYRRSLWWEVVWSAILRRSIFGKKFGLGWNIGDWDFLGG